MNKFISKLNFILLWLTAFIMTAGVYAFVFFPQNRALWLSYINPVLLKYEIICQGAFSALIVYLLLVIAIDVRKHKKIRNAYKFPACNGDASIDNKTICRLIKSIINKYDSVISSQVKVIICGSKIDISIKLKINDDLPVKTLVDNIQYSVRSILSDLFGQNIISGLHINILDVRGSKKGQISVYSSIIPRLNEEKTPAPLND